MSVVQKLQSGTWRRYSADDGGYYYHNEENDQSVWDPPAGWMEPENVGGPGAMDQLSAEGKTVPRSSSQLSSVVSDKPNRPSHQREASQDTMMSPGEVQTLKREAQGSSVSVATPVVRQQPQKSSSYDNNNHAQGGDSSPLCGCLDNCNLCWCCGVFGIIIALLSIVVLSVVLTLPQTVSCNADDKGYFVVVYDGPNISSVTPNIVCTAMSSNVTFKGSGFVKYGGNTPQVTLGSWSLNADPDSMIDCNDLDVRKQNVQTCNEFTVHLPSDDGTNKADALLTVTNPSKTPHPAAKQSSACNFVSSTTILLVRAPNVTSVNPPGVCEKTVGQITIVGTSFFSYQLTNTSDWIKPSITLPSTGIPPDAITPSDCTYYSPTGYHNASTCTQLVVQLTSNLYSAMNTFTVTNPSINGGCEGAQTAIFRVIPPSTVTSADPSALCWKSDATPVTLYGAFIEIDGQVPTFSFEGGNTEDGTITVTSLANCTTLNATSHTVRQCEIAYVLINPADRTNKNTTYYLPRLLVDNHIPGCIGASTPIATFPEPIIDATPYGLPALCSTGPNDQTVIISGSFLTFNGSKPTVRVGPLVLDPSRVNPLLCTPIGVSGGPTVSLCSRLSLTIFDANAIGAPSAVTLTYPAPLQQCTATSSYSIWQAAPPTATNVAPTSVSLGGLPVNLTIDGTLEVWNSNTVPNVRVGNTIQRTVFGVGCTGGPPQTCSGLIVTLTSSAGLSGAGNAVVVETGSCTATAPQAITFTV